MRLRLPQLPSNFIFGALVGLGLFTVLSVDLYARYQSSQISLEAQSPLMEDSNPPSDDIPEPVDALDPDLPTPTHRPTVKPSPSVTASPTPTPKPLPDYYVKRSLSVLLPDHQNNVTEFVQSGQYPRLQFYVDYGVNNSKLGDKVEYRVYEDNSLKVSQVMEVTSTDNFYFPLVYTLLINEPGSHTVRFAMNENRLVEEGSYANNTHSFTVNIIRETVAPTFQIDGPYLINGQTCLRWINLEDNVSVYTDVWAKWKFDDGAWSSPTSESPYACLTGTSGSPHTYTVHAEDRSGNVKEESKVFELY